MSAPHLANLGAEEGPGWRAHAGRPEVAAIAALWLDLLEGEASPFPFVGSERAQAWLVTEEAVALARDAGFELAGPDPAVVRAVHDKAFAHAAALEEDLEPEPFATCTRVFTPEELDADGAIDALATALETWPAWLGGRFALKPRLGSSARGRVAGEAGRLDRTALAGALPRLRARGGAVLEPWVERVADFSTQLHIAPDGGLLLLGTLEQRTAPSGRVRAHRGTLDRKGRVTSGSPRDEALREAAAALARRAAARGFHGVCGVDAFVFRDAEGAEVLRPVVELNARWTVGTVAIGLVRRHRRSITRALRLDAGQRADFVFAPAAPPGGWPPSAPPTRVTVSLGDAEGPALAAQRQDGDPAA